MGGGCMCQKCLLCQVDLLSELHFTECSQKFISLKAPQRYEQARIHICHHCPFYRVRRFLSEEAGGNTRAPFHLCLTDDASLKNTFPNSKNTNKKFPFSQGHSNVTELHSNLTGQNTKQNLRQNK